jgi:hypothetical protein
VDEHIESWINVAGTLLGVSKAMTAFLSGEMRDTVEIVSTRNCGTGGADDPSASRRLLGSGKGGRFQRGDVACPTDRSVLLPQGEGEAVP